MFKNKQSDTHKSKYYKYKKKYLELKRIIRNNEVNPLRGGSAFYIHNQTCSDKEGNTIRNLLKEKKVSEVLDIIKAIGPKIEGGIGDYNRKENVRKNMFNRTLAWAVPNQECLTAIVKFVNGDRILEVGSGTGLWAGLLQASGARVTATEPSLLLYFHPETQLIETDQIDGATAISKYSDHEVLMLIWPPYQTSLASDTLKSFTGNKLIYIGEYELGCTADQKFFDIMKDEWESVESIDIPQWYNVEDSCSLWRRKVVVKEEDEVSVAKADTVKKQE